MHRIAEQYYQNLLEVIALIEVSDKEGNALDFYHGIERVGELLLSLTVSNQKIMFIGNGASAAISSHMAADYSKNGGMRARAFDNSAMLTAVSNDLGYQHVFEKSVTMFADEGDIVFAISSSGRSENILRGAQAARQKGCTLITLSGFNADNPLRSRGDVNFYVPSPKYGPVEIIHHSICHCILDVIIVKHTTIDD